jgi:RND family efflux transporter MFP subunit
VGGRGTGGAGTRGAAVRVAPIKLDTIENTVIINGDVLARTQVSVYPTVAGKLAEARFKVGDLVRQGETLAMIDPSRPGEVYSKSPVVSPVSGTVLSAPVNPGDTLSAQTAVYVVGDLSGLLVETFVPERFTAAARRGLAAQAGFEAIPGETFPMTVDEVSPVLDPASRTLKIRLRFTKPDSRIKAGMFATVTLVTSAKHNVPVIPRSAVINTYGSWIVFTVREGTTAERREIKLGLESEDFIEVVSGLNPGEQVVTVGQNFLSDGDPVRIVEG